MVCLPSGKGRIVATAALLEAVTFGGLRLLFGGSCSDTAVVLPPTLPLVLFLPLPLPLPIAGNSGSIEDNRKTIQVTD